MPSTCIASSSSRIFREPRSAQIAEPPAPAISSAVTIGLASLITASTAAEPVNPCAPSWRLTEPSWSALTAPNGIETSAVGRIVTLARNQACSIASRHWNRRWMIERHSWTIVSRHKAKKVPLCLSGAVKVAVVIGRRSLLRPRLGAARGALARCSAVIGRGGRLGGPRRALRGRLADHSHRAPRPAPLALLRVLRRRGRRGRRCGRAVALLAHERAGWRLDVVLLEPLAGLALGPALLAVARGDLGRDRRQRRQLVPLVLLRGELG